MGSLYAHTKTLSTNAILLAADMETEFVNYDNQINLMWQYNGAPVATITALQALVNAANTVAGSPDQPITDGQIKVVKVVGDGTNNTRGIYQYVSGDSTADVDAAGVDTDGIVAPTVTGMGRWFRVGCSTNIKDRGVVALRTMRNALNINLDTDSVAADAVLVTTKRTAGSSVKWLADSTVAFRNAADNADQAITTAGITSTGNITTTGTANAITGAPAASTTVPLVVLGSSAIASGSAAGTMLGMNKATFTGNFADWQVAGVSKHSVDSSGNIVTAGGMAASGAVSGTTGSLTGALNMNTNVINGVVDPTTAQQAATKNYVDTTVASGVPFWGDGSDGAFSASSGTTTLTTDKHYSSITLTGTAVINTGGFKIYCTGIVNLASGTSIIRTGTVGSAGSGATGGAGGAALVAGSLPGSLAGVAGGSGVGGAAGAAGSTGTAATTVGGIGVAGGAGGNSGAVVRNGGAGGAAGANTASTNTLRNAFDANTGYQLLAAGNTAIYGRTVSGGGGAGGDDDTNANNAGGGGGSGSNGGYVFICSKTITNAGTISANGGIGGAGANAANRSGGGGGGGGGNGGIVILIYKTLTNTGTIQAAGGAGGAFGNLAGTGSNGVVGVTGNAGLVIQISAV